MMKTLITLGSAAALLFLSGCGDKPQPVTPANPSDAPVAQKPVAAVKIDMNELKRLFGSEPKAPAAPIQANADTVALGRVLYHENSLSKNGNLSCASCHDLDNYGVDGKPTSPGSDGVNGGRNTPTSVNAFRHFVQFWDGRAPSVEEQAIGPVLNPVEHGVKDEAELIAKLNAKPELVDGFKKAFPQDADAVTIANFKNAIGAFERTLVTKSRWDEFLDGKVKALTDEEKLGLDTFMKTGCTECHSTRMLGGDSFQVLGKAQPFPVKDQGRFDLTKNDADKQVFKVPSLVNVDKTAPYFHDGSKTTLEDTVKTMASVQLGKSLNKDQVASIVAFLKATTGELPAGVAMK